MMTYIDREKVLKLCEEFGSPELRKRIEKLPVTTVDDELVIQAEHSTIGCNIENLTL